jgi:hypothetical protein
MQRNGLNLGMAVIATLLPLFSAFISYSTGHGLWFARSGSITVLTAAIVQFRLAMQLEFSQYRALLYGVLSGFPRQASLTPLSRFLGPASLFLIVAGTLIWGYGDLLFDNP